MILDVIVFGGLFACLAGGLVRRERFFEVVIRWPVSWRGLGCGVAVVVTTVSARLFLPLSEYTQVVCVWAATLLYMGAAASALVMSGPLRTIFSGYVLNMVVIGANGFRMPVLDIPGVCGIHKAVTDDVRLLWLSDIILPQQSVSRWIQAMSIGDCVAAIGFVWLAVRLWTGPNTCHWSDDL